MERRSPTRALSGSGYGGIAIIADDQAPPTLNPFAPQGDNFIVQIIAQAWMTGVWDIDGHTLERIPEVVTELPTVANGGVVVNPNRTMTVTYHIREEAVWSDGVPISGDDFQFSDDRLGISPNSCNDNLTFRRAVMHATEEQPELEAAYSGYGVAMQSYVEAYTPSLSTNAWRRYEYDPEIVQALYQEAVAETGRECVAVFSTTSNADIRPRLAKLYVEMMEEAGIPFELELRDSSVFFGEMLDDQAVILPLYRFLTLAAVWGDEIGGFKHNPLLRVHTWNIEEWYRTDR
ncbi:MAG: ABC transporter substrate-binding protein [Acidimicrobiia bacterium]